MKKTLIISSILLTIGFLIGIYAYINQEKLIEQYIDRQIESVQSRNDILENMETITLVTVGTGSPLPSKRAKSCHAVFVRGRFFLFDTGPGSMANMERMRLPVDDITAVFVTHWHSDHYLDLPHVISRSWQFGRSKPFELYGPPGVARVSSAIDSLLFDENRFRIAHHGEHIMHSKAMQIRPHLVDPKSDMKEVYHEDGVRIRAFAVNHDPVEPSLGYRIDYAGSSLTITGDTSYDPDMATFAAGTNVLLSEVMQKSFIKRARDIQLKRNDQRMGQILDDILEYHSSPQDAARMAAEAGAEKLILTHLAPTPENPLSRRAYTSGLDSIFEGSIILAEDGDIFEIK